MDKQYEEKTQCSKCGKWCYKLCYIGSKVVCVDCFSKACEASGNNKQKLEVQ